ncbi:MAG: translation initiation factor IF-2 [Candidatus Omnitrophota bacterium]
MKVKDLAKELEVSAESVIEQLNKLYVETEDGNSPVDDKIAGLIRIKLGGALSAKKKPKKKAVKAKTAEKTKEKIKPKKKEKDAEAKKKKTDKEKEEKKSEEIKPEEKEIPEKKIKPRGGIEIIQKAPVEKPKEIIKEKSIEIIKEKAKEKTEEEIKEKKLSGKLGKKDKKYKPEIEIVERFSKGMRKPQKGRFGKDKRGRAKAGAASEFLTVSQSAISRKTPKKVQVQVPINIRSLAAYINARPNMIIQYLMGKGATFNINQDLEEDIVRDVMAFFGYELEIPETAASMEKELFAEHSDPKEDKKKENVTRAPIVTFMGHVDHGKTSLLDYIRKTMVTKGEKGGITQHIGAYKVETKKGSVTFLDTPGHAAFTAMRARGANATDVVVLVVAADDGVMPQTKEAIDHARAANVPIVVAINKCDLPGANPDKVKAGLQKEGLVSENLGGSTITVEVSARTGEGVDNLVEMLMLESEMLELKANPKIKARGIVIESRKTPGQGVVVTLLVQNGTLYAGDIVFCGSNYGKVKAMMGDKGERVDSAPPATPVEVLGLQGVPQAGDEFFVVKDEKKAKTLALLKQSNTRNKRIASNPRITLEDLHNRILEGSMKELKIVLKADVQGSVEALNQSLEELSTGEVKVNMVHSAVGNINESDVMLAMVSNAVIIGFHVKIDSKAEELAKEESVDVHKYDVIYEAIADVKAAMEGLLEPDLKEVLQGKAQVLEIFPAKKNKAAGCKITKGIIRRKDKIRIKRQQEVVYEGEIDSLKRFKDDVREVKEGFECGLSIKGFNDIRKDDIIESFIIEKIARRLEK